MGVFCFYRELIYYKLSVFGNNNFYNLIVKVWNLYVLFYEKIVNVVIEVIDINDYVLVFEFLLYVLFVVVCLMVGEMVG